MTRLNHQFELDKFNYNNNWKYFIPSDAYCKYCGITCMQAFDKLPYMMRNNINSISHERLILELKYYNEYSPCLTEEEYLIKQIIE